MVRGSILTGDVHFERVTWKGSREVRPTTATAVDFFASKNAQREFLGETPRRIAGGLGAVREARFEDAVAAFRKRHFHDRDDDVRARSRLMDTDSARGVGGRGLSIVTK